VHLVRRKQAAQVIAEQSALLLPWQLLRGVQFLVDARIGGGQMGEVVSGQWQTQSLIRDRGGWRARQILDEMVSIEPANSAPEESAYSLSPKPEAGEEDDSGPDPSFACTRCHKVFSELVKLNTHMKVHLTEKPHECE